MAVIDFLDRGALIAGDATYLEWGTQKASYREAVAFSNRFANRILSLGFKKETPIAILSPNDGRAWLCAWGVWRAACAWLPLNPRSPIAEIAEQLDRFGCRGLIFHPAFTDAAKGLHQQLPLLEFVVCLDNMEAGAGFPDLDEWCASESDARPNVRYDMLDVCAISPTGGTTGRAKGVMNTHRSFQTMVANWLSVLAYPDGARPVNLAAAPLTHTAGVFSFMATARGGKVVVLPKPDLFDLAAAVADHQVTEMFLPPTVIYRLLEHSGIGSMDFASMRYLLYGAAPMSPAKLRTALERFGPIFIQGFGQTEAPAGIACLSPGEHFIGGKIACEERLKSCGRPFVFTRVSIRGEDGSERAPGEIGEICVSGDIVMKGYFDDPEQTEAAFDGEWLKTGDVGRLDPDGFLYITDRKKDMIISGGFNVYSTEVEGTINAIEGVADCAVIGVADPEWGEIVKAVVELIPGSDLEAEVVIARCKQMLGSVKAPKLVEFVESLPRSTAGKILKRDIREGVAR